MISQDSSIAGPFFVLLLALSSWEMLAVSLIGSAITFFVFFFRDFFFFFISRHTRAG